MAVYGFSVTTQGSNLLNKLTNSGSSLNITRVQFGTGVSSATSASGLVSRTSLISPLGNGEFNSPSISNGKMFITVWYSNTMNGGISTKKNICEYGVFATDPDLGEILFLYGSLGDSPDVLLPYSSGPGIPIIRKYQLSVSVGGVSGEAINFSGVGGYVVAPSAPSDHSILWIDSAHNNLAKFWNGSTWQPITTQIPVLTSDPTDAQVGQVWIRP